MRRLPPLKTLPAFEIAAERLSFSETAAALHITHGAVSRQIKALEAHVGAPLFRRGQRRLELTDAGAALLPHVRQALALIETSATPAPQTNALVVSCLATFLMRWLIPRLYDFNARHRNIAIRLSASHAPVDFARDGHDLAIRVGKPPWPRNVAATPFLEERFGPVCAPALLAGRKAMRIADLRRHPLLHTETRPQAWADWAKRQQADIDGRKGQRFEHSYFMLEAAASGLGIAVASYPLVEAELQTGRLVAPFGFVSSGRSYCVMHAKNSAPMPAIAAFRSWIVEMAKHAPQTVMTGGGANPI